MVHLRVIWGSISDKELTGCSGIVEHLQPGDLVMADRGFLIEEFTKQRSPVYFALESVVCITIHDCCPKNI